MEFWIPHLIHGNGDGDAAGEGQHDEHNVNWVDEELMAMPYMAQVEDLQQTSQPAN